MFYKLLFLAVLTQAVFACGNKRRSALPRTVTPPAVAAAGAPSPSPQEGQELGCEYLQNPAFKPGNVDCSKRYCYALGRCAHLPRPEFFYCNAIVSESGEVACPSADKCYLEEMSSIQIAWIRRCG